MILQIKEPQDNFWLMAIGLAFILSILFSLDSHAKPKPKIKKEDTNLPIIIQSKPSTLPINEGEYLKLLKAKKTLTTNIY